MRHLIITGGAGFIGSHLCEAFLERDYAVTAIDNFCTGRRVNVETVLKDPRFRLVEADVCNPISEKSIELLEKHGLHGVLHFACPASPVDFDRIPFQILMVDSIGTKNAVDLALKYQARLILASTSEIYGDPLVHPQPESYFGNVSTTGPRACYDETKRFAEAYVSTAQRHSGLNAGILRIFNTYGPRMRPDDGRIVPELCMQALKNEPLTLHGDGKQTRSFCFVSDLVSGIVKLFESGVTQPVNLGNPREQTVSDFAEAVAKLTGTSTRFRYLPARDDDPKKRCPDIRRAEELLNWTPKVDLNEGLQKTIEYFRTQL